MEERRPRGKWQGNARPAYVLPRRSRNRLLEIARAPLNQYLKTLVNGASSWLEGSSSNDYTGYDKIIEQLAKETADTQIEKSAALVGSPKKLIEQIKSYQDSTGGDITSFSQLQRPALGGCGRLYAPFAEEVIPYV